MRIAFASTYPPRRCGIAMFTSDLAAPWATARSSRSPRPTTRAAYPPEVHHRIRRDEPPTTCGPPASLDRCVDAVSIQHEYGIWGGDDGEHVLDFVRDLDVPRSPPCTRSCARRPPHQRAGPRRPRRARPTRPSSCRGRRPPLLDDAYGIDRRVGRRHPARRPGPAAGRPAIRQAGARPRRARGDPELRPARARARATSSRSRRCRPSSRRHPDVPATSSSGRPTRTCSATRARRYRDRLVGTGRGARAWTDHVRFVDRFVGRVELGRWLEAADVFVTPYPNLDQIVSGTLSYAMSAGQAIVSTPYAYATELLADGRGVARRAGFADAARDRPHRRCSTTRSAGRASAGARTPTAASMIWPEVGAAYRRVFARVASVRRPRPPARDRRHVEGRSVPDDAEPAPLPVNRVHLDELTDDVGIMQHAIGHRPDPAHGYCTDDVARALQVDLLHGAELGWPASPTVRWRSVRFLEAAFDPALGRFRNFRSARRHLARLGRLGGCPCPGGPRAGRDRAPGRRSADPFPRPGPLRTRASGDDPAAPTCGPRPRAILACAAGASAGSVAADAALPKLLDVSGRRPPRIDPPRPTGRGRNRS